jgi:hypothetical protein
VRPAEDVRLTIAAPAAMIPVTDRESAPLLVTDRKSAPLLVLVLLLAVDTIAKSSVSPRSPSSANLAEAAVEAEAEAQLVVEFLVLLLPSADVATNPPVAYFFLQFLLLPS